MKGIFPKSAKAAVVFVLKILSAKRHEISPWKATLSSGFSAILVALTTGHGKPPCLYACSEQGVECFSRISLGKLCSFSRSTIQSATSFRTVRIDAVKFSRSIFKAP